MTTTADVRVEGATLWQFLGATQNEIAAGLTKPALEAAATKGSSQLQAWMFKTDSGGVRSELAGHVVGLLQSDAGEIFAGVWSRCAALRASANDTRGKKGVTELVALAEHEFTYSVDPEVEVVVDGVVLGGFKFSVELTCTVKGLELQVRDGGIGGIRAGKCEGSATILLAGTPLWQKALIHADLPGDLRWKRVVPIA